MRPEWLEAAKAVIRGETVQVEIVHGGPVSSWKASPKRSGAIGDIIPVSNPDSKQRISARASSPREKFS